MSIAAYQREMGITTRQRNAMMSQQKVSRRAVRILRRRWERVWTMRMVRMYQAPNMKRVRREARNLRVMVMGVAVVAGEAGGCGDEEGEADEEKNDDGD